MEARTLTEQEFLSLDAAVREPIRRRREALETELKRSLKEARTWEKEANRRPQDLAFRKYEVNVAVDHSETAGAPVVMERNPTYNNLFGRIEKEAVYGALQTDLTLIRGGSRRQAKGGARGLPGGGGL